MRQEVCPQLDTPITSQSHTHQRKLAYNYHNGPVAEVTPSMGWAKSSSSSELSVVMTMLLARVLLVLLAMLLLLVRPVALLLAAALVSPST